MIDALFVILWIATVIAAYAKGRNDENKDQNESIVEYHYEESPTRKAETFNPNWKEGGAGENWITRLYKKSGKS